MKKVLRLRGLDCAHCALELEEQLKKLKGVRFVSVGFIHQRITVHLDSDKTLQSVIDYVNGFENVRVVSENLSNEKSKNDKAELLYFLLLLIATLGFWVLFFFWSTRITEYIVYGALYLLAGYPVLLATVRNLRKKQFFDENFLMTVASLSAFALGEAFEGVMVVVLYQIGETLQSLAVNASRRSVGRLLELKSNYATVLTGNYEPTEKKCEEVEIGDTLLVRTGEKIPVDGHLTSACATIDEKSLTGEAMPRNVTIGEEVLSGCINLGDAFTMRASKRYQDSAVQRILDLVENATESKAKPEKFIAKFARYYTPIVCGLAVVLCVFVPLLSGWITDGYLHFKNFTRWANSALTFLVISCPCALVVSVPLTYFSGVGVAAEQGVLVKGATHLDTLAKADVLALDKTGTLTQGAFTICGAYGEKGYETEEIIKLAASLEKYSTHPIAKAFEVQKNIYAVENIKEKAGRGLSGTVMGEQVLVGNAEHLRENGVSFLPLPKDFGYTLVYVGKNGEFIGIVEVGDSLRTEAKSVLQELKKLGVKKTVMLTGDRRQRAEKIAQELAVDEVYFELLPDGKMQIATALKENGTLAYVGDGVNDAPVMTVADCAVSMGKLGSAAAVEASDLVLVADDLKGLCKAKRIAKKTRKIVIENIVFSITLKAVFMALGAFGALGLSLAVFADVGVMLCAVVNALRVRKYK